MNKLLRILVLLMAGVVLFSCSKEEDLNAEELLVTYSWVFNEVSSTSVDPSVQFAVALINAFYTDATYDFKNDGTYTLTVLDQSVNGV